MTPYRFLQLDVFTDRPFEGNQLAVFPEGRGLAADTMQRIALEMAFSESTFILPAERGGDVRMRIFTPHDELPMAGHPTVGSAFALAHEGRIARGQREVVFELGIGPTPVGLEWDADGLSFAWMTQQTPRFGATLEGSADGLGAALGIAGPDVMPNPAPQEISCGVPFLFVRLSSRAAVDAAIPDRRAMTRFFTDQQMPERPIFIFTLEGGADGATCYSRMFAPELGVAEDPATGSASGPLGCYLVRHQLVTPDAARELVSLQGVKMRRPSRLHISIGTRGTEIESVRVGGRAVLVAEGTLRVP